MARPGIMLYFDILEPIKVLPDADKGRLLVAMLEYGQSGRAPQFDGMLALAWGFVKPKIDKDEEEYNMSVLRRQYATTCRERKRKGEPEITFDEWLKIYNDGMKGVPNALILSKQMGKALMEKGIAYFIHNSGDILGIGIAEVDTIQAVVSCKRGYGERSMHALFGALCGDVVKVEVAENNLPAMKLYSRMGFIQTGVIKCWYDVTKNILDVK